MRRRVVSRVSFALVASFLLGAMSSESKAGLTTFPRDLAGFTAAAGSSTIGFDFDSVAAGTDIGGQTIAGVKFTAVGAPLIVVNASDTTTSGPYNKAFNVTNSLVATSGSNILSPGGATLSPGPNPAGENDSLRIDFVNPVSAVGADLLWQRADGFGFVTAKFLDAAGNELFISPGLPITASPAGADGIIPGGSDFWGIVSDTNNIKTVIVTETDSDDQNADNNIGYDSFRFATTATAAIPLPAAIAGFPMLAAVAIWARKKMV